MPDHKTIPVQVWADIDIGIASMVTYLNTIPGVRTMASCQGTIGEGGPHPYRPQVMVTWDTDETLKRLLDEFEYSGADDPEHSIENHWGYLHPREPVPPVTS